MRAKSVLLTILMTGFTWCIAAYASDNSRPDESAGAAQASVVVEIDGAKITYDEFEKKVPGAVFQARNTLYQSERGALEQFVGEYLLEREAKKEGVTVQELLDRHVSSVIPKNPSEETLRVLYETIDTKESYETIKDRIIDHLREARLAKAKAAYVQTLRDDAKVTIRLAQPRVTVSMSDTPIQGPADARVMIVEYADFECPYCQQIHPELLKLEAEYKGKVALAFKDSPLPMHAHAQKAAEAAHCAGAQGKYWEYHDLLFSSKQIEVPQLKDAARTLKLDEKAFDQCLDSGAQAAAVKAQLNEAQSLQIQGTPSFLVNGRFFSGLNYQQLRSLIDEELSGSAASVNQIAKK